MKIDFILGFLGAGKTTLIRKFINEKVFPEKVVIIENEFGEVGIDKSFLSDQPIEIKEITSGCICCSLKRDFETSLKEVVQKFNPGRLIIEPSGVATTDVVKIAENFAEEVGNARVNMRILVIDSEKYEFISSYFGEFFINQLRNAKTIILSRSQKVNSEKVHKVKLAIKSINTDVPIITSPWDNIPAKEIVMLAEQPVLNLTSQVLDSDFQVKYNNINSKAFENWGIKTPKLYSITELEKKLEKLTDKQEFGFIVRGKGIVPISAHKWVQFDYTLGEIDIRESKSVSDIGMVSIIGTNLKKLALMENFLA